LASLSRRELAIGVSAAPAAPEGAGFRYHSTPAQAASRPSDAPPPSNAIDLQLDERGFRPAIHKSGGVR